MKGNDISTFVTSSVFHFKNEDFAATSVSIGTSNPRIYSFTCEDESDEIYKVATPGISISGGKISIQEIFTGCVANPDGTIEGPFDLVFNITNL